jgi:S1-C subfamily serine protease
VEPDDEQDADSSGPLLPPDDRLWRHPSELALGSHVRAATPAHGVASGTPAPVEGRMWTVALLSGVIGALLATGVVYTVAGNRTRRVAVPALERDVDARPVVTLSSTGSVSGFVLGAERVQPSCVVLVAHDAHGTRVSSGVVFRSDGMLITTAHTVAGAQTLTATVGGNRRVTARLVAMDPGSDLAVVKLAGGGFIPAPMGSALDLKVGDPVIAVRPRANGTAGDIPGDQASVSAIGQEIVGASGGHLPDLVRIDTSLPPTTVGGPLLDNGGAVVAISTAVGGLGQSMEWATPVDLARQIASQLMASGRVVPVWLGVEGGDLSSSGALALGVTAGAKVDRVYSASPASAAGVRAGDVVIGLDGHQVTSMANLIMAVHALPPGTKIELDVERGHQEQRLTALLSPRPASVS